MGLRDNLFDFDGDGKLDTSEKAAEFATCASIMDAEEAREKVEELEMSGLDTSGLEFMDEDERREALEDAGLDPDDYDEF